MKTFSKHWKKSKNPKKQRKYEANAPIHIKRKQLSVNLSKDLREKHNKRNVILRKNDKVKIMRGKFRGKTGKVTEIKIKTQKVYIDGIQSKKQDGSSANIPIKPSKLQIIELNTEDKKRFELKNKVKKEANEKKEAKKKTRKKEAKKNEQTSKKE